ncbi:MAG: hypothetical protein JRI44_14050 [Deltaproteobacteria bacterium]|nr:hypothetical protein [Deltaproteobacteria bacterium]
MFVGVSSFLLLVWVLGTIFLPEDNISHALNPLSKFKFWLLEDTSRIETVVEYSVMVVVGIAIITPFISKKIRKKEKAKD